MTCAGSSNADRGGWPDGADLRMMGIAAADWARCLDDNLGVAVPVTEFAEAVNDQTAARFGRTLPLLPCAVEAARRAAMAQRRTGVDRQTVALSELPDLRRHLGHAAHRVAHADIPRQRTPRPLTALKVGQTLGPIGSPAPHEQQLRATP